MTEINKEDLMSDIVNLLKETTKDYPRHVDSDLIHIDMGELGTYETIFNAIYSKGPITDNAIAINKSFRKELENAHKVLEENLEIVLKRMII